MTNKICFVITDAVSFNFLCSGQLEYFSAQLSNSEIFLVCGGSPVDTKALINRKVGHVIQIDFARRPRFFKDLICLFRLFIVLHRVKPDLVVYSTFKASFLTALILKTLRTQAIYVIRGCVYRNFGGKQRKLYEFLEMICLAAADSVLFISKSLRNDFVADFPILQKKKHSLINSGSSNGVDIKKFAPNFERGMEFREMLGLPEASFVICFVGRLCHDKGLGFLTDVINRLSQKKDIAFLVAGAAEDATGEAFVESYKKNSQVFLLGRISDPSLVFNASDCHLFVSHREGFGNVAIEAASCGIPTYGFDISGVNDSIADGISGKLFPFGDLASLTDAVLDLYESSDDRSLIGIKARDWASDKFSQEKVWAYYLSEFEHFGVE